MNIVFPVYRLKSRSKCLGDEFRSNYLAISVTMVAVLTAYQRSVQIICTSGCCTNERAFYYVQSENALLLRNLAFLLSLSAFTVSMQDASKKMHCFDVWAMDMKCCI